MLKSVSAYLSRFHSLESGTLEFVSACFFARIFLFKSYINTRTIRPLARSPARPHASSPARQLAVHPFSGNTHRSYNVRKMRTIDCDFYRAFIDINHYYKYFWEIVTMMEYNGRFINL